MTRNRPHIPRPEADYGPNRTILMYWPNSRFHGWAYLQIRLRSPEEDEAYDGSYDWYEKNMLHSEISYLSDTYSQIVDALIALAEGAEEASAFADMEPDRAEFRFVRKPGPETPVALKIFDWCPEHYVDGQRVYSYDHPWWAEEIGTEREIALKHLMDDVLSIGAALKDRFGEEGYRRAWGPRLPVTGLAKLQALRELQDRT